MKFILKSEITNPNLVSNEACFKIFNRWISNSEEIFIDVADYQHVQDGPQVILVGHYADIVIDKTNHQTSFMYRHRRDKGDLSPEKSLSQGLMSFKKRLENFQKESEFSGQLNVATQKITLIINDRSIQEDCLDIVSQVFTKTKIQKIKSDSDTRQSFLIQI